MSTEQTRDLKVNTAMGAWLGIDRRYIYAVYEWYYGIEDENIATDCIIVVLYI